MKILITGCRGFVGGSVGRFAAHAGHTVIGIGLSSQPEPDWPGGYHQADIAHADLVGLIDDFAPDVVLHAAGTASVGASLAAPLADLRAAVLTWANTLDGIRRSRCRPMVLFPSSAAVYGNPQRLPVGEGDAIAPISPYGFHKAACELLAEEFRTCFGLNVVIARFFSLFGPRQRRLLVWEIFRQATGEDTEILLKGSGEETRDYLFIDDATEALLQISGLGANAPNVVNLGSGAGTSVRALAELIAEAVGSRKSIRALGQPLQGDPHTWIADIQILRRLGFENANALDVQISRCVREWQCI